jgi:hypothetical protein
VFISNTIFEGERSFNHTSTASTVDVRSFTLLPPPPSLHHHLRLHLPRLQPSPIVFAASPSPLLRDVGLTNISAAPSQARMQLQLPLPFLKGCGPAPSDVKSPAPTAYIVNATMDLKTRRHNAGIGNHTRSVVYPAP